MKATPREVEYSGDKPFIRWFASMYPGTCGSCDDPFAAGDRVGYHEKNGLVGFDCCAEPSDEFTGRDFDKGRRTEHAVMPRGKTVKDTCQRCFLIHTTAQGDQCE